MQGVIVSVTDRGFGFVRPNGEQREIYFHATDLAGLSFDIHLVGEHIDFDIVTADDGRPRASHVRPLVIEPV